MRWERQDDVWPTVRYGTENLSQDDFGCFRVPFVPPESMSRFEFRRATTNHTLLNALLLLPAWFRLLTVRSRSFDWRVRRKKSMSVSTSWRSKCQTMLAPGR